MIDPQTIEILQEMSKTLAALNDNMKKTNEQLTIALLQMSVSLDKIEKLVSDNK